LGPFISNKEDEALIIWPQIWNQQLLRILIQAVGCYNKSKDSFLAWIFVG
jgi:hypothetical protein